MKYAMTTDNEKNKLIIKFIEDTQKFCRRKLNQKPLTLNSKYNEGYADGIRVVMSYLHNEKSSKEM